MIDEFLSIGIVGAFLSLGVEFIQSRYGASSKQAKALAIGGSVMLGGIVWFLSSTPYYASALGVLASSSTVYALFFSSKKNNADAS